ncbi:hypothetical protein HK100_000848 [Physocladia obscura]|uniref:Defect at low temperature protein 1 n=1 Tax=Physocladia obscura TaxID=109957 RepID=A0AAD5XFB2_9FUNG|nr:hypothetical protein HK100_000848 [Physocladia obscura]
MRIKILSVSSLLVFITLESTLVGVCGLDLFIQIVSIKNDASALTKFLFILGAACLLMIIASVTILSARKYRIKSALSRIPRNYVPINEMDMPRTLFQHVQKKFSESASIRAALKPLPEEMHVDGYGRYDGRTVYFKTAISKTLFVLIETVSLRDSRISYDKNKRLESYFQRLHTNNIPFNEDIAESYIRQYEAFAAHPNEVTEFEYLDFMKLFAALLQSMQTTF